MNALDIIKLACDFTGNEDIALKLDEEQELSANDNKVLNTLLKCLNLVQNEVACEYIPLASEQNVRAKDFKIDYSSFNKKPISIVSVKDSLGRNIRFKAFADYLVVYGNKARVKYYYLPQKIQTVESEITECLLPIRTYAYGVAREYFLLQSLSDEADIWEGRFKDSLCAFARKKQDVIMPCRRWL